MNRFISYIFIIIIPLYFLQGLLYPSGSLISQSFLVIWLLVCLYSIVRIQLNRYRLEGFEKYILIFWILNAFYWFFSEKVVIGSFGWSVSTANMFKNISIALLSYFPFKYFVKQRYISDTLIKKLSLTLLLLFSVLFIYEGRKMMFNSEIQDENVTNNISYFIASLLPILGIYFYRKWIYLFFIISFILVFISAKRGAIVCEVFAFLVFAYFTISRVDANKKKSNVFLLLMSILLITYFSYQEMLSNEYILKRFEKTLEGDSSGRDVIYGSLINTILTAKSSSILFGFGFAKSIELSGNYAHQDWLEIASSSGLIGLYFYAMIYFSMIRYYLRNKSDMDGLSKYMYLSALVILFLKSSFSMSYNSIDSFLLFASIAISINRHKKHI